jgi:uncharacterized membrane protein
MFYRISLITNSIIAAVVLILATIGMATDSKMKADEIIGVTCMLLLFMIFLWFNIICFKVNQANKDNTLVNPALKRTGNILFVFNIIAAAVIMFCIVAMAAAAATVGDPGFRKSTWPFYVGFILVFFLSGTTAIINCIGFKKAIKKNKLFSDDFINAIGESV